MRILFTIPRLYQAGPDRVLLRLVRGLQARGHTPLVAPLYDDGPFRAPFDKAGVLVEGLDLQAPLYPRHRFPVRAVAAARRAAKLQPDVWQSFFYTPVWQEGVIAQLAGIPYAMRWAGLPADEFGKWRLKSELCDRIVVLLDSLIPWMYSARLQSRLPIRVIPNGIDVDTFRPDPDTRAKVRRKMGWNDDDVVCIYTAKMRRVKRHDYLIRRLANLAEACPNLRLAFAGGGESEHAIRQVRAECGLEDRCEMLGVRDDLPELLCAADFSAAPSTIEGLSNSLLESMAAGLPCIVTSAPWSWGIIEHGQNGFLAPLNAPELWETLMQSLVRSAELRRHVGEYARTTIVQSFSIQAMIDKYEKLYEDMVVNCKHGRSFKGLVRAGRASLRGAFLSNRFEQESRPEKKLPPDDRAESVDLSTYQAPSASAAGGFMKDEL